MLCSHLPSTSKLFVTFINEFNTTQVYLSKLHSSTIKNTSVSVSELFHWGYDWTVKVRFTVTLVGDISD